MVFEEFELNMPSTDNHYMKTFSVFFAHLFEWITTPTALPFQKLWMAPGSEMCCLWSHCGNRNWNKNVVNGMILRSNWIENGGLTLTIAKG